VGRRGRPAGAKVTKRGGLTALRPQNHPHSIAWRVDQDYVDRLAPDEAQWLADFIDRYYGADFRGPSASSWTDEEKRERYRAKNAANRDVVTWSVTFSGQHGDFTLDGRVGDEDLSPTPAYQESPTYKKALATFRQDPSPANRVRLHQAVKKG